MKRLLPLTLLLGLSCSRVAPESEKVSGKDTGPPSEAIAAAPPNVPNVGTATGEGRMIKAGWSVAFWNEKDSELVVGFLEAEPSADQLEKMKESQSLFMGVFLDVPMIEFTIGFEEKDGVPDVELPTSWRILYDNFGDKGPMTLNYVGEDGGRVVEVSGNPKTGGKVKGRFSGTGNFSLDDDNRDYSWNLAFDVPVH